jgi:hypothetical protein
MKKPRKPKTDAALAIGDRLLTLSEAAELLRLNPRTVRDYSDGLTEEAIEICSAVEVRARARREWQKCGRHGSARGHLSIVYRNNVEPWKSVLCHARSRGFRLCSHPP